MNFPNRSKISWGVLVGIVGALLMSAVSMAIAPDCLSCRTASESIKHINFAWAGILFYGALLLPALASLSTITFAGLALAVGAHSVFIVFLLRHHLICLPCLGVAFCALLGFIPLFWAGKRNVILALILLPLGAAAGAGLIFADRQLEARETRILSRIAVESAGKAESLDKIRVVIYQSPSCHYCEEVRMRYEPSLLEEFDAKILIEHRPSDGKLPTPTIVVFGSTPKVFLGKPPLWELRTAILNAMSPRP